MSRKAVFSRWLLLMLAVLLPIAAAAAYGCVRWGRLGLAAIQVVMKMVVVP